MLVVDKRFWPQFVEELENKNVEIIESVDIELIKHMMKRALGHK